MTWRFALLTVSALAACADPEVDPAPDAEPEPECGPSGGGPHALVEGEPVTITLACATADEVRDGAAFTIDALPAGAAYDPTTATITWTPALDQAAVYDLALGVVDETLAGTVRIAVADAFDTPGNVPPTDPKRYPEELGVPVLFLSPRPTSEDYQPVTVVYGGRSYAAEAKLRGASSLNYPKQSYIVKFGTYFHDPDAAGGFLRKQRIVLTSTFDDNTFVRQRLGFQLWNDLDPAHVPVQAYSAVVYLDGEFWGVYALTDHVDDELFAAHGLPEAGNVYKSYNHDANFTLLRHNGSAKATLHDGYDKKAGLPIDGDPGAFDDLDALVSFVATSSDATFAAELPDRVALDDFRDWYVFATYTLAGDSGGKNAYLYHDPLTGPWRYVPWDLNFSFGQDWQTYRLGSDELDDFQSLNRMFVRMNADPVLGAALDARYRELLDGPLSTASVLARYEVMVTETEAVARRDWRRWETAYRAYPGWSDRTDFLDYDAEVDYVRTWLTEREAAVRASLP